MIVQITDRMQEKAVIKIMCMTTVMIYFNSKLTFRIETSSVYVVLLLKSILLTTLYINTVCDHYTAMHNVTTDLSDSSDLHMHLAGQWASSQNSAPQY